MRYSLPLALMLAPLAAFLAIAADEKQPDPAKYVPTLGGSLSRNLVNLTDKNVPDNFSLKRDPKTEELLDKKSVKWEALLGTQSYLPPVIADGKVYVATNNDRPREGKKADKGVLMCFDEKTGKFLWQLAHDALPSDLNYHRQGGMMCSPHVDGDRVYYVTNRAEVVCASTAGKILWSYDMIKELNVFVGQHMYSSPLVLGDLVYAITCNGTSIQGNKLVSPKAPSLVALDKKTGKLAWSCNLPGDNVMRGQWTNPAAALVNGKWQVIFGGGDGWLYGLDAKSGDLVWKFDCNPKKATPYQPGGRGERSFIIGTPVVVDGKCYVATGQEPDDGPGVGHLWCVDITKKPANKDKDLSPVDDNFDPKAPVNKDSGLVWHYGGKITPEPKGGAKKYVFGRTLSTVAVHDGIVYAPETLGYLHAIDAKTGQKLWEHDFSESTWCSPYYVDGKIYIGTESGDLYIFQAGRKANKPKAIEVGPPFKVPVAVVNGVLYINTGSSLIAIVNPNK